MYFPKAPILVMELGFLAQWVAHMMAHPGSQVCIPSQPHNFCGDHEIISTVIFLLPLIQEWQLSVTSESMCTKYW